MNIAAYLDEIRRLTDVGGPDFYLIRNGVNCGQRLDASGRPTYVLEQLRNNRAKVTSI